MMMVTGLVISGVPAIGVLLDRQGHRESAALVDLRGDRHGPAEAPHQCTDMCKSYALAGLILGAGAAEQLEDALVVLGLDAAAVVDDINHGEAELGAAADFDVAGHAGLEVLQ